MASQIQRFYTEHGELDTEQPELVWIDEKVPWFVTQGQRNGNATILGFIPSDSTPPLLVAVVVKVFCDNDLYAAEKDYVFMQVKDNLKNSSSSRVLGIKCTKFESKRVKGPELKVALSKTFGAGPFYKKHKK